MKKFIVFIITLTAVVIGCMAEASAYSTVDNVRIGIYYGSNARAEYTLDCESGFYVGYYDGRSFISAGESGLTRLKIVKGGGNSVEAVNPLTGETVYSFDTTSYGLGIVPKADRMKITASASGTYRGGFDFRVFSGGNITAVNVVPLDSYLYGVISREMSPSWPKEALKAQAVCARNFAVGRLNHHKEYGFDLCNTVCCQAYSGVDYEAAGSYAPVDETSGKVLLCGTELVQTVYSSSMGPCTEDVKNVWGSNFSYLVSVSNEYEDTANIPNGVWTKELTKARATEIMNSKGYNIGEVVSVKALEYTPAGRVLRLEVTGTSGSKIFERESCRTIFSEATLSQMYTVTGGGETSYPNIYVLGSSGKSALPLNNAGVLGGNAPSAVYATDGTGTAVYQGTVSTSDSFIFSGQGWGHGVGMSQYGAKGMAEAGFDYEAILTHYYTGTHIEG